MTFCFITLPLLCALSSNSVAATTQWQTDYNAAKMIALNQHKPMAVFIGEGIEGWKKLSPEVTFDGIINETLANGFVALYVDKSTDGGKALADVFGMSDHTGLVISDKDVNKQAFSHSGTVPANDLAIVLTKYSHETAPVVQTQDIVQPVVVPVQYVPAPVQGGGCPNGNCPRQMQTMQYRY